MLVNVKPPIKAAENMINEQFLKHMLYLFPDVDEALGWILSMDQNKIESIIQKEGKFMMHESIPDTPFSIKREINPSSFEPSEVQMNGRARDKIINYADNISRNGVWAEGIFDFYCLTRMLLDKYQINAKLVFYNKDNGKIEETYNQIPNIDIDKPDSEPEPESEQKPEPKLIKFHILNLHQYHFQVIENYKYYKMRTS